MWDARLFQATLSRGMRAWSDDSRAGGDVVVMPTEPDDAAHPQRGEEQADDREDPNVPGEGREGRKGEERRAAPQRSTNAKRREPESGQGEGGRGEATAESTWSPEERGRPISRVPGVQARSITRQIEDPTGAV